VAAERGHPRELAGREYVAIAVDRDAAGPVMLVAACRHHRFDLERLLSAAGRTEAVAGRDARTRRTRRFMDAPAKHLATVIATATVVDNGAVWAGWRASE